MSELLDNRLTVRTVALVAGLHLLPAGSDDVRAGHVGGEEHSDEHPYRHCVGADWVWPARSPACGSASEPGQTDSPEQDVAQDESGPCLIPDSGSWKE